MHGYKYLIHIQQTHSRFILKGYILFLSLLLSGPVSGQQCGFDTYRVQIEEQHKHFQEINQKFDQSRAMRDQVSFKSSVDFTLPMVFHIIHNNDDANISEARILQSLEELNQAFANEGYYDPTTGENTEIQFCLAQQDPDRLPTSGITRNVSPLSVLVSDTQDRALKDIIRWDPTCYINVWIVSEISNLSSGSGVAGYAYLPSAHGSAVDGIVVEAKFMGVSAARTTVLIHEVGHYLGLYHTFEGGCKNDDCMIDGDRICDTPPDQSTASVNCNDAVNTCNTDALSGLNADQNDMINNYMDYGFNECYNAFTPDQASRMRSAITDIRSSLLACQSCKEPCTINITADINVSTTEVAIGQNYTLDVNVSSVVNEFKWFSDGTEISQAKSFNYAFNTLGKKIIVIEASNGDPKCVAKDSICVDVICPIETRIEVRDTNCVDINEIVTIEHFTTGSWSDIIWYVDGQEVSRNNVLTLQYPNYGVRNIYAVLSNGSCSVQSSVIPLYVGCQEVCGNEIDDDGDGLIDGFDPDCCDQEDLHYFKPCIQNCPSDRVDIYSDVQLKWTASSALWSSGNTPIVGDVDNDGEVEIVGYEIYEHLFSQREIKNLLIINGLTGQLESRITTPRWTAFAHSPAMADVDRDGIAEIFVIDRNIIRRYDLVPNGAPRITWARGLNNAVYTVPSITDFNQDGRPEILVGNQIYDSETGTVLHSLSSTINQGKIDFVASNVGSIAVDVLSSDFCPSCDGLELVAGNEVYSVDINDANTSAILNLEVKADAGQDGYTAIVDFDNDGDLDAVLNYTTEEPNFQARRHFRVWDIQTPDLITSDYNYIADFDRVSQAVAGDVTGDGKADICVADGALLTCIEWNAGQWNRLFRLNTNDWSGMSGCVLYDFDGDNIKELVYRDESRLYIVNARNGNILMQQACSSVTGHDVPVVADIDMDKQAELVCSCNDQLWAFEPQQNPWTLTRPVWNQRNYFNVNVNDDLTIPYSQQLHHLPSIRDKMNNFFSQYSYTDLRLPDLEMTVDSFNCAIDSVQYYATLCNKGSWPFAGNFPIAIYSGNPTQINVSASLILNPAINNLEIDSCVNYSFKIHKSRANPLFFVLNDDGSQVTPFDLTTDFPFTGIEECDYENNIGLLENPYVNLNLDLGPDTVMCDFGVQFFDAGPGFTRYRWQDGSADQSLTAFEPGRYWVEVEDDCGIIYYDTVRVDIDPATVLDLGEDIQICPGDTISVSLPIVGDYIVRPDAQLSCTGCNELQISSDTSVMLIVTGTNALGCVSTDSINIELIEDFFMLSDSVFICDGDSTFVNEEWIKDPGVYQEFRAADQGCDSLYETTVLISESFNSLDTVYLCGLNDSLLIYGIWQSQPGLYEELKSSIDACDSLFETRIIRTDISELTLQSPIEIIQGQNTTLNIEGDLSRVQSVQWLPSTGLSCSDCLSPTILGISDQVYTATVYFSDDCFTTLSIEVSVQELGNVFIPNVFTPNDDGRNDYLQVFHKNYISEFNSIMVYNRWGDLMYSEHNIDLTTWPGWDGSTRGQMSETGVYVYIIEITNTLGEQEVITGDVTILY